MGGRRKLLANTEIRRVCQAENFGDNFTAGQQEAVEKRHAKVAGDD